MKKPAASARKRAELIMKVRCGLMSASQAAAELGVSRKTYYKWERKGLTGMLESVCDRPAGRHRLATEARETTLEKQLARMSRENALLQKRMALKDIAFQLNVRSGSDRAKKNEQITRMVARMERLKRAFGISLAALAADAGISYGCLMRWRRRIGSGKSPLQAPGPKKTTPLDLQQLHQDIARLQHGRKRSRQTTGVHRAHANSLSRRDIDALIRDARKRGNHKRATSGRRVIWRAPNLTWALDGSQYRSGVVAGKFHMQNLQDLCSRYKFPPLTTDYPPCGEEVSGYLAHQFTQFGAPLFCKRDNGGNLNHLAVNALFEEAFVIPINAPISTPPYNGAIEHAQGELKGYLRTWQSMASLGLLAETAAHDLNHKSRRVLGGRNACQIYFGENALRYPKRKRKSIYRWIRDLAAEISIRTGKPKISSIAWRIAAKTWLQKNNLITIVKAGEVLPYFPNILCHH